MSVETAEPPPLFFARSPSPPSFSPPHSPPPALAPPPTQFTSMSQQPTIPAPNATADLDVDMSMSITIPPPQGQNHDRDGHAGRQEEGDAMDTTPDGGTPPAPGPADAGVFVTSANVQTSSEEERLAFQAIVDAANGNALPPVVPASSIPPPPHSVRSHDDDASTPSRSRSQSPRHHHARTSQRHRDADSSEDEDDGQPSWHELHEDTSSPSESELREIEARTERSALDHEHWEAETFASFQDPEYRAGAAGRISWTINGYNGTKDKPNKEVIMKSEVVSIGGYDWQLKFFPRGNDSDFLSVYVDCVSFSDNADSSQGVQGDGDGGNAKPPRLPLTARRQPRPDDGEMLPIPLLPGQQAERSLGVSAQVGVVLYNPAEPRVHVHKTWTHRHCAKHSDYGQTRFYGPYFEIALRQRGQRAAMLRNDSLALTAYIRVVEDETNCLGEHSDLKSNPWDSFAMTGVQGMSMIGRTRGMGGSNVVSAVTTWMHLRPFRQFLYSIQQLVPDPTTTEGARQPPMPVIKALLKILYCLRTPEQSSNSVNVSLHDLHDAMTWYRLDTKMDGMDVVRVMEIFRTKLQSELQRAGSLSSSALDAVLGPFKNHISGLPVYRVGEADSFQAAILATPQAVQGTPAALIVEVQRQHFDTTSRTWKKLTSPMKLDREILVNGKAYSLQSFVAHDESLQSGGYRTVVRHSRGDHDEWYLVQDNRILAETRNNANFRVERITERQMHQLAGSEVVAPSQSVAYLVTYVRSDTAVSGTEEWDVAPWIATEVALDREMDAEFSGEPTSTTPQDDAEASTSTKSDAEPQPPVDFEIVDSKVFLQHTGPGICDTYRAPKKRVLLPADAKLAEIQKRLVGHFEGVKDPRQFRVRLIDSHSGMVDKPVLLQYVDEHEPVDSPMAELVDKITENRLWVHVLDAKDLPPAPEAQEERPNSASIPAPPAATSAGNTGSAIAEAQDAMLAGSNLDAVMSDAPEDNPWATTTSTGQPNRDSVTIIELPSLRIDANGIAVMNGTPIPPGGSAPGNQPAQMHDTTLKSHTSSALRNGSIPKPEEIYFFLKVFDAEKQCFTPKGSFIESKKARVDKAVAKILGINGSSDAPDFPELFEEDDLRNVRALRRRKTFQQEDLLSTCIVIVNFASKNDAASLHARGLAATPEEYLQHCSYKRNFPHLWSSDNVTFDYFSSECYSGGWQAGQPHGNGTKVSFDGSTYAGSFQLGQRHGEGRLTYPNGDTYAGSFADGCRDGQGTFTEAATGNSYEGGWRGDKQFGEGVKRYKQAEYDERICRVCWVDEADAVFVDCGHVMLCLGCARRVDVCPKCRAKVKFAIKFWLD